MNLNRRLIGNADPTTDRSEDVELRIAHIACLLVLPLHAPSAWSEPAPTELPGGAQISAGQASIAVNGSRMDVNQASQNAGINWQTFNIGSDAQVNFHQPNSAAVAVNRIADPNGSQIMGKLNANGQVYLINPNGVLFGRGAQVNVGGLVASTLDTDNSYLVADRRRFTSTGGTGKIVNRGTLSAPDGYIALLGGQVSNQGVIQAKLGTVALAAGDKITLEFAGDKLVNVEVDKGALQALAENKQLIQADGGTVLMTAKAADALLSTVVNNEGVIEARTVEEHNGVIKLLGDMDSGTVNVGGTLDASAPPSSPSGPGAGGEGNNGGFIETSAAHVKVANGAVITTKAENGRSGTWLIDPVDFTIASGSATQTTSGIGATTLTNSLVGGNISIATDGSTGGNGDIFVNSPVTWSSNKLTLTAHRNIAINANLNGSGTASLALEYGQGGGGGDYSLSNGAKVSLPSGLNFSTKNGAAAAIDWTVITSLGLENSVTGTNLQGMQGDLAGKYALGADINASDTSGWTGGFTPVGTVIFIPCCTSTPFTGKFDGLGHTISNLFIDRNVNAPVGLFGATNNATLQNVGLLNVNLYGGTDGTGALVGKADNTTIIRNSYADGGSVRAHSHYVGGLVGIALSSTSISYSYANVSVESSDGGNASDAFAGGLVGGNNGGSIDHSYATGSVTGKASDPTHNKGIGGLVGQQTGTGSISTSYATGAVSAVAVDGSSTLGGLIGQPSGGGGSVTSSYWDKTTTGQSSTADVTGGGGGDGTGLTTAQWLTNGPFSSSPSDGAWSTADWGSGSPYPGVKALPYITITASASQTYGSAATFGIASILDQTGTNATGLVNTGSLIWSAGTTASTAAGTTSAVRGSGATGTGYQILYAGNLTVGKTPLTVTANGLSKTYDGLAYSGGNGVGYSGFVNSEGSGVLGGALAYGGSSQGAINTGSYIITPSGLSSGNYTISYVDGTLTVNKANATVTANSGNLTYNGLNQFISSFTATGLVNGETTAVLTGVSAYGSGTDAGRYAITASGSATNYNLSFVPGTLTIAKALLTATANNAGKNYNGLAYNGGNGVTYAGFVNGETAAVLGGTLVYSGSSQGAVNTGSYTITPSGLTSSNYTINYASGSLTIDPAALTVAALNASKIYDGLAWSGGNGVSYSGFVNGENASALGGVPVYSGSSQGAINAGNYSIIPSGLTSGNYTISYVSANLAITPATLTYTATPVVSFFNGQIPADLSGTVTGFAANDTLENSTTGTLTWTTDAVADSRFGQYAINGGGLASVIGNYIFAQASGNASALTLQPSRPPESVINTMAQLEANPQTNNQPGSNTITVAQETASGSANVPLPESGSIVQLNNHQNAMFTSSNTGSTLKLMTPGIRLPDNRIGEN